MPAAVRASSTAGNGQTATTNVLNITIPGSAVVGDYAIIQVTSNSDLSTLTTPSGWTLLSGKDVIGTVGSAWLFGRTIASGNPGASVSLAFNNSSRRNAVMTVLSGVNTTGIQIGKVTDNTSINPTTIPSFTSAADDSMFWIGFSRRYGGIVAPDVSTPSGYTDIVRAATAYGTLPELSTEAFFKLATSPGPIGGESATVNDISVGVNYAVSLPATDAPPPGPIQTYVIRGGNKIEVTTIVPRGGGPVPNTPRFPGDPQPLLFRRTFWGSAYLANGEVGPRYESPTGIKLAIHRRYTNQLSQVDAPNGSFFTFVRDDHTNNRLPCVSLKTDWAQAASGALDATFDQLIVELNSYTKPTWVILNHEPENDSGVASQWRAQQIRFRSRINAWKTAHPGSTNRIAFGSNLMVFTWNPTSGRNPEDWWCGPGVHDFVGGDHYTEAANQIERSNPFGNFVNWCRAKNMPFCLPEWGLRTEDPNGATKMQTFYNLMTNGTYDCIGLMYFDSDSNSTGTGWTLDNQFGILNKFYSIMADPKSIHLTNL